MFIAVSQYGELGWNKELIVKQAQFPMRSLLRLIQLIHLTLTLFGKFHKQKQGQGRAIVIGCYYNCSIYKTQKDCSNEHGKIEYKMKEDFKMKNVRIGVGFVFCFIATIALFIFNNLVIIPNVEKNENITYYIIASNAFNKPGEFRKIDENGNLLSKKKVKIQDVTEFNFDKQNFIAGEHRFNNNIIIDENGNCKLFSLLNNPNHSGVTSINVNGNQIIAVMNGNVTDNTYKNLFVVQNKEEEILKKEIIDIYSSDSLIKENVAYIVGGYLSVQEGHIWSSKVMKIDLNSYEIEEKIYDKNNDIG